MTTYIRWNDALAAQVFRPDLAGQPVWLYITEELIRKLGLSDEGVSSFVEAVKEGPPWVTAHGLCQRALQAFDGWRQRGVEYPPYLAYLGLFVLAAGLEGEYAPQAYYPRLRTLLGEAPGGPLPSFARMLELWDDLERWSTQDRQGSLGVFEARIVGEQIHIGLPLAQTILSADELRSLPRLFAEAGLDPASPPPDDEVARLLRIHGGELRARTRALLRAGRGSDGYGALLDRVVDELTQWDGTFQEDLRAAPSKMGVLRLCVMFDRVSSEIRASLRCHVQEELPDGGLLLTDGRHRSVDCYESGLPGWSSVLRQAGTGEDFNAATLAWDQPLVLRDAGLGWRCRLAERDVRIFVDGRSEGLPGLVEVGRIPRGRHVYFAYMHRHASRLTQWGQNSCRGFAIHPIVRGLPEGWDFASCSEVVNDEGVRSVFPELALSERIHIALVGGIRRARGREYFSFALPCLALEGGDGSEAVTCNGHRLTPLPETRSYSIADGMARDLRLTIEVVRNGEPIRRLSLYLTGSFEWRHTIPEQLLNGLGGASTTGVGAAGVTWIGPHAELDAFEPNVMLAPGLRLDAPSVYFVGRLPGQISAWPGEPPATDWRPIWAIAMWRRGQAVYCGRDLDRAEPIPNLPDGDRQGVERWKDILWHQRKRITPPDFPALARLWRAYVEAGRIA